MVYAMALSSEYGNDYCVLLATPLVKNSHVARRCSARTMRHSLHSVTVAGRAYNEALALSIAGLRSISSESTARKAFASFRTLFNGVA